MDNNLTKICKRTKDIFKNLNLTAHKTKFMQRTSKLDGESIINTVILTQYLCRQASLEDYSTNYRLLTGKNISRQGFDKRINKNTNNFLKEILTQLIKIIPNKNCVNPKLLSSFSSVKVIDSTSIELNEALKDNFKGSGGCASASAVKIQTIFSPLSNNLNYFDITAGNVPDNKFICNFTNIEELESNSLLLMDLGYSSVDFFNSLNDNNIKFITRYKKDLKIFSIQNPEKEIDLIELLKNNKNKNIIDTNILLTKKHFPCRIIIYPVKDKTFRERLKKKKRDYQKKGNVLNDNAIELLKWSIMITNTSIDEVNTLNIYKIYRLRWSIELFFKLWKSELDFDYLSTFKEDRLYFEIYSKLICVLIFTNFTQLLLSDVDEEIEISPFKSFSCFKLFIYEFLKCVYSSKRLEQFIISNKLLFIRKFLKKSYKKRKTTLSKLNVHNKGGWKISYEAL